MAETEIHRQPVGHQHPFDAVAPGYDAAFTGQPLGRWLRSAVWQAFARAFRAGDAVLDLGCGTGEDACWLAERGVCVTATDAADGMLTVTRAKAAAAGLTAWISFAQLDLNALAMTAPPALPVPTPSRRFDGAYANFGPLNCVADRRAFAGALAALIRPGGMFVAVVMGPLCPWEIAWYLAHGHPRTAIRRFRSGFPSRVGDGSIRVWYPSPGRLRAELDPYFRHVETVGIGTLLPPSDLGHLVSRAPRLFAGLNAVDDRMRGSFLWSRLNDHYLSIFQRR